MTLEGVFGLCVDFLGESRLLIFSTKYVSVVTNTIIIKQVTILYTTTATKYYTTTATLQKQQLNTLQKQLLNTLQQHSFHPWKVTLLESLLKLFIPGKLHCWNPCWHFSSLESYIVGILADTFHPWKVTLLESLLTLLMFNFFVLSLYWIWAKHHWRLHNFYLLLVPFHVRATVGLDLEGIICFFMY